MIGIVPSRKRLVVSAGMLLRGTFMNGILPVRERLVASVAMPSGVRA
jgi:hypothetical protein